MKTKKEKTKSMSIHHLVPRQRLRDYYGMTFYLPENTLRLWRYRHDAWHVLFGNKTLNEIIRYLGSRPQKISGYKGIFWKQLFGEKNRTQAKKLLMRMRNIVRRAYSYFEFDPSLQKAILDVVKKNQRYFARIRLNKQFRQRVLHQRAS